MATIRDSPQVFGNSGKLQQVFTNLLLNARDAIPAGGSIRISTMPAEDDSLTIEVSDSGIGIAPENVAKIYDPFYTTKGVGRGTGLGLAVSYGIVQEHSGHISVESTPGSRHDFSHHPADGALRARGCRQLATSSEPSANRQDWQSCRSLSQI